MTAHAGSYDAVGRTAPDPLVEATGLTKRYMVRTRRGKRPLTAVDDVHLRIPAGHTVGLVGESGCGKSTTGRLLLNLERPSAGTVFFDGQNVTAASGARLRALRRDIQVIFQDPYASLDPRMRVRSLLAEPFRIHGLHASRDVRAEIRELLDLVGLAESTTERYAGQLSGGQRQRVAIARAIALRPRFVVCDEPVSALDVSVQAQVINLLRRLQRELGLTYLFVSHDLSVVRYMCDSTAVMYLGRVVEHADTAALFADPRHPYTQTLLSAIPLPNPDGRESRRRIRPVGEVPSPLNRPPGCGFAPRCPLATQRCRDERPTLRELADGRRVACHYAETAQLRTTA